MGSYLMSPGMDLPCEEGKRVVTTLSGFHHMSHREATMQTAQSSCPGSPPDTGDGWEPVLCRGEIDFGGSGKKRGKVGVQRPRPDGQRLRVASCTCDNGNHEVRDSCLTPHSRGKDILKRPLAHRPYPKRVLGPTHLCHALKPRLLPHAQNPSGTPSNLTFTLFLESPNPMLPTCALTLNSSAPYPAVCEGAKQRGPLYAL